MILIQVVSGDTVYTSALKFEDLNLSSDLIKGLYVEMSFSRPSKIQGVTLPMILTPPYKDLVAQAHNGSGKTTCFVLGMLSRVDPNLKAPQAICICPTRELAQQVCYSSCFVNSYRIYGRRTDLRYCIFLQLRSRKEIKMPLHILQKMLNIRS